ncbi:MAG: hypothetical protein B6I36_10520 [Desulfobacteraceae bacterium 4572_35.1]|nr:MAG: hypothetical protein B6I36_10520 [Desulfobacteraceae bacterium 4572_35.1]
MSKKLKMMIALTVLMMVGFISTSLLSYFTARNSLFDQVSNSALPLTSDNIYSKIQQDLLLPIFISSVMAQDTFVRDWTIAGEKDPDKIVRYLNEIQHKYHTVTSFYVSERTRNYYHPSGIIKQVSKKELQDAWYFRNRTMKAEYEINIDRDSADMSSMTVFINHRVFDYSGNFIGVIGIGLGVKTVQTLIEQYQQCFARIIFFTIGPLKIGETNRGISFTLKATHFPRKLSPKTTWNFLAPP